MSGLVVLAALAAAVAIGALAMLLHRAARLERLLEEHDRDEADLEALADATREPRPWGQPDACGCYWLYGGPGHDPVYVPCDRHAERTLREVDGEQ